MFFFNRKKLTAIDGKVDIIQEQLEQNTHKIEEIMLNLHKLDNRLEVIPNYQGSREWHFSRIKLHAEGFKERS